MGYSDVQQMIIATLMGRDPGTEIQAENHQEYALALLDYTRSIELMGASALMGVATVATIPVEPSGGSVFYLANLASGTTYTFSNFYDSSENAIQITTSTAEVGFATLIWNTVSWSSEVTTYTFNEEEYLKEIATKFDQLEQNSYINGYVAGADGTLVVSADYRNSGMLAFDLTNGVTSYSEEVLAGDEVACIAFYSSTYTYLGGVGQDTETVSLPRANFIIPPEAAYVVHSYKVSSASHSFSYKAPQILQGLGDSKTAPISQEIVTEELNKKVNSTDSRLSDARPASDVYDWAKEENKPTYTPSEIGLSNVNNTSDLSKPISTLTQEAINNIPITTIVQTVGDSKEAVMSQKATTDADLAIVDAIPEVVQTVGDSKEAVMSQAAATAIFLQQTATPEDLAAYGVEFDTTISSPTCTRIGNTTYHRSLPIQSKMRGCLLSDDGAVVRYLNANDWTGEDRSGTTGQVMIEIPKHYRKFVTDGTVRQVWISEYPLIGYNTVPKMYVSAYEASVNRTTTTLASVVNLDADYRGGGNNTAYDDTYRSFLGRPATNISLTNFRTYARNRKENSTEWNCMTYEAQKTIFWLFVTEYATLNSQSAVNAELTAEGYKQGGLGDGPTTVSSTNWSNFNGYYPFIPCGHTDSLGNGTGQVLYEVFDEGNDVTISIYANRYRGVENPFGHIWQWADGILVDIRTDDYAGDYAGQSRVLVAQDPANFASHSTLADTYEGYEFRGLQARTSSYINEIIFGEYGDMMAEVVGGSSSTFFCDQNYTSVTGSSMRGVLFGGTAIDGSLAGFACSRSYYSPSTTSSYIGSRLCFHPNV